MTGQYYLKGKQVAVKDKNGNELCIHSQIKLYCAVCNGECDAKAKAKRETEISRKKLSYKKRVGHILQILSKKTATRHDELISEEDIKFFFRNTIDTEKEDYELFFKIALKLQRTVYAIQWWWNIGWNDKYLENISDKTYNKMKNLVKKFDKIKQSLFRQEIIK